ncbi:germin-like protein subfamily 1 member 13 [Gossypium raimondii]|nr:germin-like protein subfamily 1 member 13 [Gossypium raimondii]
MAKEITLLLIQVLRRSVEGIGDQSKGCDGCGFSANTNSVLEGFSIGKRFSCTSKHVGDMNLKTFHTLFVNGKFCKDAKLAKADDFYFSGLHIHKNTSNTFGSTVTPVNVAQIPGLHTLGISMVRIDYAPNGGLNPPHTHPRASEVLVVLEGTLHVGFATSNPDNRLISKVLYPGDVFVFPVGLIHFQYNIGNTYAVAFAGLSSENPGVITIANAVFGSNPSTNADILAKAFNLERKMVKNLQSKF